MIFVILVFKKSIDVPHQSNTALLKYPDSFLVQLGSRPCYTRRLSSHYKKAVVRIQEGRPSYHYSPFWQSKTTCFTFQSHRFCLPKYATFKGKTTCFTSSTHILWPSKSATWMSEMAEGFLQRGLPWSPSLLFMMQSSVMLFAFVASFPCTFPGHFKWMM